MRIPALLLALCLAADVVWAVDLDDADFGLRFTAAITRFSRYPDVAGMGGASAGSRWSSGINPASTGWSPPVGKRKWGIASQYSHIMFDNGTDVNVLSGSAAFETKNSGTFQPAVLGLGSNTATTLQGLDFEWDAYYAELQWGLKTSEKFAWGLNINVLTSEIDQSLGPVPVSESRGETYGFRVGGLWEHTQKLYLGLVIDYAWNPTRTKVFDFMQTGTGDITTKDTIHQFLLRPGLSWIATKDLTVNVDYQFSLFDDDTGTLRLHRFYAGLDPTIVRGVYFRGGTVVDNEGNVAWALGLGIAPSETLLIDFAYQKDLFPEIEPEFGGSDLFTLSVTILF